MKPSRRAPKSERRRTNERRALPIALDDVSVVIPVRIDSPDRLRNLGLVLTWLNLHFTGLETLVVEHDSHARADTVVHEHGAQHIFLESDGCFHKSAVFNLGIALAEHRYVLLYDCDVLFEPDAISEAVALLRAGAADCVYPYNGVMLQIRCDHERPETCLDAPFAAGGAFSGAAGEALPPQVEYLHGSHEEPSTGGAIVCNRRQLLLWGGFNENIVSYGCEDTELETRLIKLGARLQRLNGHNCFHVHHRRGQDSHYNNFHCANLAEWRKVQAMSRSELARYVRNGFRRLRLDSRRGLEVVDDADRFAFELTDPTKIGLDDVAFVLALPASGAFPAALVAALIDSLEASYDNYELHLVEQGGNRYRPVSHRDHVIYRSIAVAAGEDWLRAVTADTDRGLLCVCTPFVDTEPGALLGALDRLRRRDGLACELAASSRLDSRAARLRDTMAAALPAGNRSFAFDRVSLIAWLEDRSVDERSADVGGTLRAALQALASTRI